jgi:hypothetical protein
VRQGQFWLLQGAADIIHDDPAHASHATFIQYRSENASNHWATHNVQIRGSMEALAATIRAGSCTCVADGSFKNNHGTAAWKILDLDQPQNSFEGQCVTPGTPEQQNAYRSELSGLYAATLAVNAMIKYFKLPSGALTLACDNLGAITTTEYEPGGANPSSCAQFDLVMAIQQMKSRTIKWNHIHVDGHQDTKKTKPLTPIELINVEMDTKAKLHWANTQHVHPMNRIINFDGEPWSIFLAKK